MQENNSSGHIKFVLRGGKKKLFFFDYLPTQITAKKFRDFI